MVTTQQDKPQRMQAYQTILVAFLTTMATACCYFHDDELKLPERRVVLTAEAPEFDARFAVVTNLEWFKLKLKLHSLEPTETSLMVKPIGDQAERVVFERTSQTTDDPEWSNLEVDVNANACGQEFFALDFQATVVAADTSTPITGKLLIAAAPPERAHASSKSSTYLSVEARD